MMNRDHVLLLLKAIVFLDFFAVSLVVPLLSSYFRDAGVGTEMYGLISSLYSSSQIVGGLTIGILSDIISKKDILIISFVGSALSYGIVGSSTSILILFGSRVLVGLVKQTVTMSTTIITDLTIGDHISRSVQLGHISAIISAAFIVGPSIGGMMYKVDKRIPAYAAVGLFLVNIAACLYFLPNNFLNSPIATSSEKSNPESVVSEKLPASPRTLSGFFSNLQNMVSIPGVSEALAARLVLSFFESSVSSRNVVNYYEAKFGLQTYQRGFLTSAYGIIGLVVQTFLIGPVLSRTRNDYNLILICTIVMTVASLVEHTTSSIEVYFICSFAPSIVAFSLLNAAIRSQFSRLVPREHTGKVLGVQGVLLSTVGVVSPLYGSQIFSMFGGAVNKGLVSAAHFAVLSLVSLALSLRSKRVVGNNHID
eukprot:gene4782-9513_t